MEHLSKINNNFFSYNTANEAFENLYNYIILNGENISNTKAIYNCGFWIKQPENNEITCSFRKWSKTYAQREFNWYLSKNISVVELKKYAPIWDKMHSGDNIVNSNYGFQWSRNNQLEYAINELKNNKESRRSCITILDSKEHKLHKYDTPCTCSIGFYIPKETNKLNMTIHMRSNDLWFGFCNDQYCFSNLQKIVSNELKIEIGFYFHFVTNMHLYNDNIYINNLNE